MFAEKLFVLLNNVIMTCNIKSMFQRSYNVPPSEFQQLEAMAEDSDVFIVRVNKIVASKLSGIGVFAVGNEVVSFHV
jgi:hypothetical protein